MATQVKTNGTRSSADWPSHIWSAEQVRAAVIRSPETIKLVSKCGKVTVSVHKELLCCFSRYYRAALKGNFSEARRDSLVVDLSSDNLEDFVAWIYTGKITTQTAYEDTRLYIFGDQVDIIALRRSIIYEFYKSSDVVLSYDLVKIIQGELPASSALREWTLANFINHWTPEDDDSDPCLLDTDNDPDNNLASFMYQVLRGVAQREKSDSLRYCCCHNACDYHEHESEEEWLATCGEAQDSKLPIHLEQMNISKANDTTREVSRESRY